MVYFGYFDLVFYYFGFVLGFYVVVFEVGGGDIVGEFVEVCNGGINCGCYVFIFFLMLLVLDGV